MNKSFLEKKYPKLPVAPEVATAVRRQEIRTGKKVSHGPDQRIGAYLNRLAEIFEEPDQFKRERKVNILKKKLYDLFVIKSEEIPESYFDLQKRIDRERGHGQVTITSEARQQMIATVINDQKHSLDSWIDYLGSSDAVYPAWFKYFVFRNIVKLAEYDKQKKRFKKRSGGTISLFPDINQEALAYVASELIKKYKKQSTADNQEWQTLLQGENFAKMYTYAIENITPISQEQKEIIDGKWVKYDQGSDHLPLYQSLQGQGTGWCTAGEETAKCQLQTGDFYVYYTKDKAGQYIVPRVAIRMEAGDIAETRGISSQQNLEANMTDIAEKKMKTLPGAEKYKKRTADMKSLTAIEEKTKQNQELTKEDLMFLYETKQNIDGFGYQKDPRIKEIINTRKNIRADLAFVFDTTEDKISLNQEEALKGAIVFHYGDLNFYGLTSARDLTLPTYIGGNLYFRTLTSGEDLTLPTYVGGSLNLCSLASVKDLTLPTHIGRDLYLNNLTSDEGLILPTHIGRNLYLNKLSLAEDLEFFERINRSPYLVSQRFEKGLKLPDYPTSRLALRKLIFAKGLILPDHIGGSLYLYRLTSAEKEKLREQYPDLHII